MTMPRAIHISYPPKTTLANLPVDVQLPTVMYTRPSASTVIAPLYLDKRLVKVTLRSSYDALRDICIEMDVMGSVGIAKMVWMEDSK